MNYPTNLLRAFAVVCSWRILRAKISTFFGSTKLGNQNNGRYRIFSVDKG